MVDYLILRRDFPLKYGLKNLLKKIKKIFKEVLTKKHIEVIIITVVRNYQKY